MKKITKRTFALAVTMLLMASANAQRWVNIQQETPPIIYVNETVNEAPDIVEIFHETKGEYFHDPQAPRFVLVDQEGRWGLGIGGFVQAKMEYDFDKIVDNIDFLPSSIQRGAGPASQFQMDASTSSLFVKLVAKSRLLGHFIVYTSGNFRGSNYGFHLLNAYIKTPYFTFGYTTGSFMDVVVCPATIDYAGPCGVAFYRTPQFMFNYKFDWGMTLGIALEAPNVSASKNEFVSTGKQRMPNIPIFVKYSFAEDCHVRAAGIMRDISYNNLIKNTEHQKIGWGAQLSALGTMGKLQLSGQYTIGEGVGSFLNDASNVGVDIVPAPGDSGEMMMMLTQGWFASMQYNFNKMFFASATFSQTNIFSRRGYGDANPEAYKRGEYVVANLFCNASSNLQLGVEYLHGWRHDFNGRTYNANRVNLSARYSF